MDGISNCSQDDEYQFLNDRNILNFLKNEMEQEKARCNQIMDLLKGQIEQLREELHHKNDVISKLLSNQEMLLIYNNTLQGQYINAVTPQDKRIPTSNKTINKCINDITSPILNEQRSHILNSPAPLKDNTSHQINNIEDNETTNDRRTNDNNNSDLKKTTVEIIGDSMLNNIHPRGLSKHGNVKVLNHSGATSEDIKDHINPSIKRKPDIIILHIGSNDLAKNVDTLPNLEIILNRIKRKSSATRFVISSLIQRHDRPNIELKVDHLNEQLRKFCEENLLVFLDNKNIDDSCLGRGKLHPNKKGKAYMANNFIQCVEEIK